MSPSAATLLVSVVMPAYNAQCFVGEAIDSVLAQKHANLEIVVVDDGSTDGTADIVRSYGDRVVYVRQENAGPARARNAAIARSRGEMIAIIDSDDLWVPGKLAKQVDFLLNNPEVGLVFGDMECFNESGTVLRSAFEKLKFIPGDRPGIVANAFARLLRYNTIPGNVLMRRTCYERVGGYDEELRRCEDWDLWIRIARLYPIGCIPEVLLRKRIHGGNLTGNARSMAVDGIRVQEKVLRQFPEDVPQAGVDMRRLLAESYFGLGYFDWNDGDLSAARRSFGRSLRCAPGSRVVLYWLVSCLPGGIIASLRSLVVRFRCLTRAKGEAGASEVRKILFLETGIGFGGAAIDLLRHIEALDLSRFQPIVVTPRGTAGYEEFGRVSSWHVIPDQIVPRARMSRACHRLIPWKWLASRLASAADYLLNVAPFTFRLARLARREKAELILLNNEPVSNMAGVWASRLLGIPSVLYLKGNLWDARVTRRLLRRIRGFVAESLFLKQQLVSQGVDGDRVTVVRNIRDWERFNPERWGAGVRAEWNVQPGQPVVGMVGLLIPWKGQRVFIEAARRVLSKFPEARFLIVGGGVGAFPDYPGELAEAVRRVGCDGRIVFLGQRKDVPSILAGLDILIHASVEPEPAGAVVAEGMAMGKPVIATNIGGPPEVIEDGRTGFLVPPGDPVALSEKIALLIREPERRRAMGKAAREFVVANFSLEGDSRRLEAIYEEILSRTRIIPPSGLKRRAEGEAGA